MAKSNSIVIVKGVDSVVALIGSIATKQGDYRNAVSSAVLSAVAHSLEHGETSTITKLFTEMFTASYRDLKVVKAFIESVTPIVIEEVADGRRKRLAVKACQFMKNDFERKGTQKEQGEAAVKALKKHNSRAEVFNTFCQEDGEMRVRNLEWKDGDDKDTKTVGVAYNCDIFKWFEDVEYIRKAVKGADADAIDPIKVVPLTAYETIAPKVTDILKLLEVVDVADRSDEMKADIEALQAIATRCAADIAVMADKRTQAVEVAKLTQAGATEEQCTAWIAQRAKRVSEGKDAANIESEFKAYVETFKADKSAA